MVYGILTCGDDLQFNCNKVCAKIKFLADNKGISKFDGFLSFFDTVEKGFEEKITHIITDFFPNTNEDFFIQSGFDKTAISIPQRTDETDEFNPFAVYKSLYLAIFCSRIKTEKHLFITGTIDFNKKTAEEVSDIEDKFKVVISKIRSNYYDVDKCEFIYISQKDKQFDNEIGLQTKRFAPNTSLSDIIYYLQNSTVVLEDDKHVYSKIVNDELKKNKEQLEQIDFYFPGDKSSMLLFDLSVFQTIKDIIIDNPEAKIKLVFHSLQYYASKQQMDSWNKEDWKPSWLENFSDKDTEKQNVNNLLSIFAQNLEPQLMMLVDTILRTASNSELKHFEVDSEQFFNQNYKNQSAIVITYKKSKDDKKPLWMCYSNSSEENKDWISITKLEDAQTINEDSNFSAINTISTLFRDNYTEDKLEISFSPFILSGAPGSGKSATTLYYARMEHLNESGDSQAIKVFSSDDRINNRAYSDNIEYRIISSKFDWANPSRKEAEDRIRFLVNKCYEKEKSDINRLKELLKTLYPNKADQIDKETKETKLHEKFDDFFIKKYRKVEYNLRAHSTVDTIDLAWSQKQRCDLGGKEPMDPYIRLRLFLRGYVNLLLVNAEKPFAEEDFETVRRTIPGITENSWVIVKKNLIKLEENVELFQKMSNHIFEEYYKEYEQNPALADPSLRRNIFKLKTDALGKKCDNCDFKQNGCYKECPDWLENKNMFKEKLKKDIFEPRIRFYLDYAQHIIVRQPEIDKTADLIQKIIQSPDYKKGLPEVKPAPYMNNDADSFASDTLQNRFCEIWNTEFPELSWNSFIQKHKVSEFIKRTREPLTTELEKFSSKTLEEYFNSAEFLKSEFFLYLLMNEEWIKTGKNQEDLFSIKKEKDWENKEEILKNGLEQMIFQTSSLKKEKVNDYLHYMTSGNAHDLSQEKNYTPADKINYLHDDRKKDVIFDFLNKRKYTRFDILSDNAGVELFYDCLFAWYLLQTNTVEKIFIHVKPWPMFVSDATKNDFETLKEIIKKQNETIYTMLTQYEQKDDNSNKNGEGRLIIQSDEEAFYMPEFEDCQFIKKIIQDGCELLIVKGDLNYRRLVGDLKWENTQPIKPIIAPFITCRCLCLRCIKSDVLLGLTKEEAAEANSIPRHELTKEGKFATIQFI